MEKVAKFLFTIDRVIFEHNVTQYFLLGFFGATIAGTVVGVFAPSFLTLWIGIGLGVYFGLFAYRFVTNKQELAYVKKLYQEKGSFPFLKGFNYSLLLGPLGLVLAVFLACLPRENS
jgi:hypothetical protein